MKHLVLPGACEAPLAEDTGEAWTLVTDVALGGAFYDRLRNVEGETVGVRYYMLGGLPFDRNAVFAQFLNDERFAFNQAGSHVDIVFAREHADALQRDLLEIGYEQEFGGDGVVRKGDVLGIEFDLW